MVTSPARTTVVTIVSLGISPKATIMIRVLNFRPIATLLSPKGHPSSLSILMIITIILLLTGINKEFRCGVSSCEDKALHSRKNCTVFNNLPVGARWDLVKAEGVVSMVFEPLD